MKCMDCISVCPNDALYFGFGKPTIAVSKKSKDSEELFPNVAGRNSRRPPCFWEVSCAVRGVYGLVPFLMALGCASVTTFLFLKTWRLLRANDVFFHRFNLKHSGNFKKPDGPS